MKLLLLVFVVAISLTGCATAPETSLETKPSASLSAEQAAAAAREAATAAQAAEAKRVLVEKNIRDALSLVNAAAAFDAKAKVAGLLVDALQALAGVKGDLANVVTHSSVSEKSATDAGKKAATDQAELTRFRADDPTLKTINRWAAGLAIAGVLIAIFGGLACAGVFASVPFLAGLAGRAAVILVGVGLACTGAGIALYMLSELLVSIRAAMKYAPLVIAGAAAAWAIWHWGVQKTAAKNIAKTIDQAVAEKAIVWTPAATAIANKIQGIVTRAVVDSAQTPATPAKPAPGVPA